MMFLARPKLASAESGAARDSASTRLESDSPARLMPPIRMSSRRFSAVIVDAASTVEGSSSVRINGVSFYASLLEFS